MKSSAKLAAACVVGAAILTVSAHSAVAADALGWPPVTAQARPWAWWWWHGSAVDQTNIAHELRRFHDAGVGGVQITTIYGVKGAEARDIPYLTPDWLAMMGCAVDTARGLGMGVDMSLGSGWCFGGPTVSGQDANANVVVRTFEAQAGGKIDEKINRDATQALVACSSDGTCIDLTGSISAAGAVIWTAPAGTNSWTVYAISQKPSGQKVKRPAPGGEGWMLNPAYAKSVRDWLRWFDGALAGYHGSKPEAVFQDSYEYRTDWAPDFFAQFEKLRGYKLQTELPALFGDAQDEHTARVKYDYRRTISDIMAEQSEPAWIGWAHQNGFSTIYQAHGTPANWLDLYADADMPETEMFHNDRNILISKFASSAAHTQGHPLTGAETGTWLKEHFTETLADVKYLADDMFLSGVNRIYYHGSCYSPDDAAWPGWLFYASTEMNSRNSIWRDVPTVNDYIARCQSILQRGKPDNDVLLYWPVADFWSDPSGRILPMSVSAVTWFKEQAIGRTAQELWNHGYAFDYVSDSQLLRAKAARGKIRTAGGDYTAIIVPECRYMPLETIQQLLALARDGARIVFQGSLPSEVAGAGDLAKRETEFQKAKSQFQTMIPPSGGSPAGIQTAGVLTGDLEFLLPACGIPRETMTDDGLQFLRRSFDGGNAYLVVNRSGTNFDGWVTLARFAKAAECLDPMTGKTGIPAQTGVMTDSAGKRFPGNRHLQKVHLQLASGESMILRTFLNRTVSGRYWNSWENSGPAVEISGTWNVKFINGGPTLPAEYQTAKLGSWTTAPDQSAQAFAGAARYEIGFDAPDAAGKTFALNLGDVRQSARVKVNGKDYGTLVIPPYRVVVDNLKPAGNVLDVEATSVSANRIRDLDRRGVQWKIFKDINIVDVDYHPFNAANWPLAECGLLGPVTLAEVRAE